MSFKTIAGRSDGVFWWFPALSEDQEKKMLNSPKLSCGFKLASYCHVVSLTIHYYQYFVLTVLTPYIKDIRHTVINIKTQIHNVIFIAYKIGGLLCFWRESDVIMCIGDVRLFKWWVGPVRKTLNIETSSLHAQKLAHGSEYFSSGIHFRLPLGYCRDKSPSIILQIIGQVVWCLVWKQGDCVY